MADKTADQLKMDRAADAAFQDWLKLQESLTAEEKDGIKKAVTWWKSNYMEAGHRRLGSIFLGRRG